MVKLTPICTDTGVPLMSITVLPFRYQPSEPVENSLTSAIMSLPLMLILMGLAWPRKSARLIGQVDFLAMIPSHLRFGVRTPSVVRPGPHHTTTQPTGDNTDSRRGRLFPLPPAVRYNDKHEHNPAKSTA